MLITRICSHTLRDRPLVVPLDRRVRVWVSGDQEVYSPSTASWHASARQPVVEISAAKNACSSATARRAFFDPPQEARGEEREG
jgi:NAD kinase